MNNIQNVWSNQCPPHLSYIGLPQHHNKNTQLAFTFSLSLSLSLRAKELRRQQRYCDKSCYQHCVRNVNTVLMGGLGGDPDSSSFSDEGSTMHACTLKFILYLVA